MNKVGPPADMMRRFKEDCVRRVMAGIEPGGDPVFPLAGELVSLDESGSEHRRNLTLPDSRAVIARHRRMRAMPARVMRQDREIKELFRQKIREKIARERRAIQERIDEEVPSWISWALKPLAGLVHESKVRRDAEVGQGGEDRAGFSLWLWLSKQWVLVNDVVLEPKPDEFIQIDHVLVGPLGVFLIETKAWEGAFTAYKDNWKRKEGSRWVPCDSPTKQNVRHLRLFRVWLEDVLPDLKSVLPQDGITPLVLLLRAKWLRVKDCSMQVFQSTLDLHTYLRRRPRLLTDDQVTLIADTLTRAKPLGRQTTGATSGGPIPGKETPAKGADPLKVSVRVEAAAGSDAVEASQGGPQVQTGLTKEGRRWVKVVGTREQADELHARYMARGQRPSPLQRDRFTQGAWFFYVD
jgi:hypothetical protein